MPDDPVDAPALRCTLSAEFRTELGRVGDPASIRSWRGFRKIARTGDGGWIVVPANMPPLLMYGPDGAFERTVGRAGEGPGEFQSPSQVSVDRTDSIWVSDTGRIVLLDPTGEPARTLSSPGYAIDGFTLSNQPYSFLVRASQTRDDPFPYVMVRSRTLQPTRGLGPGLDDPRADGRTIKAVATGTLFVSDSLVLTDVAQDSELSWIDRWTPDGYEIWMTRQEVWWELGYDGDPPAWPYLSFMNLALTSDGSGGYWNLAAVRRSPREETGAPFYWNLEPEERTRAFASYLIHISGEGTITGVAELSEAPAEFVDSEHLVYPWVDRDTGLITLRIWRVSRECAAD